MRRMIAVAVALLALPIAAQVQQGSALYEEGRFEEAKRLLAPMKNDAEALLILGRIAMAQNDSETAADYLEKAVQLKPNSAPAHFALGQAYGNQAQSANMFKQASLATKTKSEFERAVELDPNYLDARLGLIDYYMIAPGIMGGSEDKAIEQAAEIKKRDVYYGHRAYARVYQRQKKNDLVRAEWVAAIKDQPQAAKPHVSLALYYAFTDKNYAAAWTEIETALKLEPNWVPMQFRVGQIAAVSGQQFARGEEALRKYLAYKPKENEPDLANTHYYLGMIYEKQGKKAEAKQSYAAAVKMNPGAKAFNEALKRVS